MRRPLSAGALAVPAPRPAAGPTLAFLQFLLGPANAPFSGHLLLGILDPADELVAGQRRDVLPGAECRGVGDQRLEQVRGKLVHHPTGHSVAAHRGTVAVQGRACCRGHTGWLEDLLLARLALDSSLQGQGLGESLLIDVLERATAAVGAAGGRLIAVDAIDSTVAEFYEHYGFVRCPDVLLRLVRKSSDVARSRSVTPSR